ncbi:MAG: hypothetical protein D6714_14875, partial [Bacteroidetes bacterium]
TVECEAGTDPGITGSPVVSDNCDVDLEVEFADVLTGTGCDQAISRTWMATDNCGNISECVQVISLIDTTLPGINCPPNITVACTDSIPPSVTGTPFAFDNCSPNPAVDYSDLMSGDSCALMVQRTWTVTDDCGNQASCVQEIVMTDTQAPSLSCAAGKTIECDQPVEFDEPTASDDCSSNISLTYSDDTTQVSACEQIITRTWTATDLCGNTATCAQAIQIIDATAPEITCPPAIEIECDLGTGPATTGIPSGTDNCDMDLDFDYSDVPVSGAGCALTLERTWTATDNCGNQTSCTQIITTTDTGVPTINCPPAKTIECATPSDPASLGEPFAFDNCDPALDLVFEDSITVLDDCSTEIDRKWTATDDCGNIGECHQIITVTDLTAPAVTCPDDLTLECGSSTDPAQTGLPTGSDICDANLDFTYTDDTTSNNCPLVISRTWTATDNCGNATSCTQTLTLTDTTSPELSFNHPALNGLNHCDTLQTECGDFEPFSENDVLATDNCTASPGIQFFENFAPGACGLTGTYTFEWVATDDCGNADTLKIVVEVTDTEPPVLTPNHPMIEDAQDGDTLLVDCENFWFLDENAVLAEDACGTATVTFEEEVEQSDCVSQNGLKVTLSCHWIATDECGNADTLTLIMKVVDNTPPVILGVPADTSVTCANIPPAATVTASDGCDGNPTLTFNEYVNPPVGGSQSCELVREWTATDECGNTSVQKQIVTILDCMGCFMPGNPGFISFNATPTGDGQLLEWTFTAVTRPHIFTVQRSADKVHFEDIGILEGRLNFASESDTYTFTDEAPRTGNNYYRIRALNLGDTPIFSDTIWVRNLLDNQSRAPKYQIYPNPTSSKLYVEMLTNREASVTLAIHNEL